MLASNRLIIIFKALKRWAVIELRSPRRVDGLGDTATVTRQEGPLYERRRATKARRCVSGARRAEGDERSKPPGEAVWLHPRRVNNLQAEDRLQVALQNLSRLPRRGAPRTCSDTGPYPGWTKIATFRKRIAFHTALPLNRRPDRQ